MTIQITVDPVSRNITVSPTVANFRVGEVVQWEAIGGTSLTLSFVGNRTPLDVPTVSAAPGTGTTGVRKIAPGAAGRYHYGLTTTIWGKNYQITGCPEIVVS